MRPQAPGFFVVGVGRSGTSLMRSFLISHPRIAIPPETGFLPLLLRLRPLWWSSKHGLRTRVFCQLVFANGRLGHAGYVESDLVGFLSSRNASNHHGAISLLYQWLVRDQEWGLEAGATGMIGDKTPSYSARMGLLLEEFPDSKFIVMTRDHAGLSASLERVAWAPNSQRSILAYRRYFERQPYRLRDDGRILVVSYEELVADQQRVLDRTLSFLGCEVIPLNHRRFAGSVTRGNLDPSIHSRLAEELSLPEGSVQTLGRPALAGDWGWNDRALYYSFAVGEQRHRLRSILRAAKRLR